jgi:cytochrome c-type biogenesis protein CcmF
VGVATFFLARNVFASVGLMACAFAGAVVVQEYVRGVQARRKVTDDGYFEAMGNLWRRNGRRYGGYMVHLGIVFIGVAIVGNEFYQQTSNVTLSRGEVAQVGGFTLTYTGMEVETKSNREEYIAKLSVSNEDQSRDLGVVSPQRNIYFKTPDMPTSEVGLRMSPIQDVYVVLNGWESGGESATFTIYINPLTMWLWIGGIVLVLGTLICTWPHPGQRKTVAVQSVAYAAGD